MEKVARVTKIFFLLLFGSASILVFKNTSGFDIESIAQRLIFPFFFIITFLGIFQRVFLIAFVIGITYMILGEPTSFDDDFSIGMGIMTVILFIIMGLPLFFKKLNVMSFEILAFSIGCLSMAISSAFTGEISSIPSRYNHSMTTINVNDNPEYFWILLSIYLVAGIALSSLTYKNFKNKKFYNTDTNSEI